MKFICPSCGKETQAPSASQYIDGSVRVSQRVGIFHRRYFAHCWCDKCGGMLGFRFDVELTKEQADQLDAEANIKAIIPMGRVIE